MVEDDTGAVERIDYQNRKPLNSWAGIPEEPGFKREGFPTPPFHPVGARVAHHAETLSLFGQLGNGAEIQVRPLNWMPKNILKIF